MACHITVLGDSSSSGIGLGRDCYPAQLFQLLSRELDVHVYNTAVPGFTSADASRLFHDAAAAGSLDYVIVYLGNNEGAVGARKGAYNPVATRLTELLSKRPEPTFRPVLSPPRFQFSYEVPVHAVATTPREFRDNLRSIVRRATSRGARLIMINPVANRRFPSGLGAVNSSYFCYLDQFDTLGGPLVNGPVDSVSEALAGGLRCFAEGRFAAAHASWEPLASLTNVAGFIARHNIACARARLGDVAAESQLRGLLGEYDGYDSTVLYNLAALVRCRADQGAADALSEAAYEKDASLYRIRKEYRDVIAGFVSMPGVRVLDLEPLLTPAHFIDYCHPTEKGHEVIARAIAELIQSDDPRALPSGGSSYAVSFPTPDYRHHPGQTLLDYYCIDWPIPQARIDGTVIAALGCSSGADDRNRDDQLDACVANFLRVNSRHPAFTGHLNLLGAWAPRSHEILSCPEQFLYRVLYNYARAFEHDGTARRLSTAARLEDVRLSSADYQRITLKTADADLETGLDTTRAYLNAIVGKVQHQLTSGGPMFRVTIGQRIRAVLTWFTREALRYGTQSRVSMLYARGDIEQLLEGLIVAAVIADRRGEDRVLARIDTQMAQVLSLLRVHERHVRRYHDEAGSFSVGEYQADLTDVEHSIKAHCDR